MHMNKLLMSLFSVLFTFYLLNAGLVGYKRLAPSEAEQNFVSKMAVLREKGLSFDPRTPLEVIADRNAEGMTTWPILAPTHFIGHELKIGGKLVQPLSSVADANSVSCNSDGSYPIFRTDKQGFVNPPERQSAQGVDIALLGDSYTFGYCVQSKDNIAGQLDALGHYTVNYGYGGNGPLLELASLKEYALERRAKWYVWICYLGNDFSDLNRELTSNILTRYLSDVHYRQNLRELGPELDLALRDRAQRILDRPKGQEAKQGNLMGDLLLLRSLRGMLNLSLATMAPNVDMPWNLGYQRLEQTFGEVLGMARDLVEAQGGSFLFVIIPNVQDLSNARTSREYEIAQRTVEHLGLQCVDMLPLLEGEDNRSRLLPLVEGHFSPEGYGVVARAIHEALTKSGGENNEIPLVAP